VRLLDSRRVFGPTLGAPGPAALAEVTFEGEGDGATALDTWRAAVLEVLPAAQLWVRRFAGGAALAIGGALDELMPLTDVNEWAIARAAGAESPLSVAELHTALTAAADPALRHLLAWGEAHGVPVLVDDTFVSLGLGARAQVFPRGRLGTPDERVVGTVPVVMVTGTNGKTTSARYLARIAAEAGHTVGLATTDGVHVGGALIAPGDFTGPDAARLVLRRPEVTFAVLETARGGILRRGLALACDVALLTNVSDDHLGLYGVDDVATMAEVKAVVGHAATRAVVVNHDDAHLATQRFAAPVVGFSPSGGPAPWTVEDGAIVGRGARLAEVAELPLAYGGAAGYNVANALGAAAAADAIGLPWEALRRGLLGLRQGENPGRGNLWTVGATGVLLDFAHNPEGVRGLVALARALGGESVAWVCGLPGDRSDDALRAVARELAAARPLAVYLHDLQGYLRGRAPGVVPALLASELERLGVAPARVERVDGELDGVARALGRAAAGGVRLVVVMPHLERAVVPAFLTANGGRAAD
jgi:UDP-N-acetylmuramyl pentapeptide synthase